MMLFIWGWNRVRLSWQGSILSRGSTSWQFSQSQFLFMQHRCSHFFKHEFRQLKKLKFLRHNSRTVSEINLLQYWCEPTMEIMKTQYNLQVFFCKNKTWVRSLTCIQSRTNALHLQPSSKRSTTKKGSSIIQTITVNKLNTYIFSTGCSHTVVFNHPLLIFMISGVLKLIF